MRKVIIVAGLGDNGRELKIASAGWKKEGLKPIIFLPKWDNNETAKTKLVRLIRVIDVESKKGPVFLVGISAGASLAMNAFVQRLDKVDKMVSLCGRLRFGWSRGMVKRKLQEDTLKHRAFRESVELLTEKVGLLKREELQRIMTVSAKHGDELIPIGTSKLRGATNTLVPTIGHLISIAAAMTLHFQPIKKFLFNQ